MTFDEIKTIADDWFEWPEESREGVTYTSCILFAGDMYQRGQQTEREKYQELIAAAEAVIDRWNTPLWKDAEPTAAVIYRMRDALEKLKT